MKLEIKTKRMRLRLVLPDDVELLAALNRDPEVFKFFPKGTQDREQTTSRIAEFVFSYEQCKIPMFMMFDSSTNDFIGRCGFGLLNNGEIEVGYVTHQQYWGKGYASEALIAVLAWARENLNVDQIIAIAPVDHHASQRVMQHGGMEFYKNDIAHGIACCFYRFKLR